MNIPQPTELAEKITDTAGQLADKIDTHDLVDRASSGASDLLGAATSGGSSKKKGLLIGAVVAVVLVLVARRALR